MRPEQLQLRQLIALCEHHGVLLHHCRDSRQCAGTPGLPDVILAGPGGVLFAELKSSNRGLTEGQTTWRWTLTAAGANVVVWLPSHFRDQTVQAAIIALARPRVSTRDKRL